MMRWLRRLFGIGRADERDEAGIDVVDYLRRQREAAQRETKRLREGRADVLGEALIPRRQHTPRAPRKEARNGGTV